MNWSKDVFPNINRTQAAEIDLDFQTRPSQGPNTSSVWICCKSVHRFPRYSYTNKNVTDSAKNRTLRSSLRAA